MRLTLISESFKAYPLINGLLHELSTKLTSLGFELVEPTGKYRPNGAISPRYFICVKLPESECNYDSAFNKIKRDITDADEMKFYMSKHKCCVWIKASNRDIEIITHNTLVYKISSNRFSDYTKETVIDEIVAKLKETIKDLDDIVVRMLEMNAARILSRRKTDERQRQHEINQLARQNQRESGLGMGMSLSLQQTHVAPPLRPKWHKDLIDRQERNISHAGWDWHQDADGKWFKKPPSR